MVPIFRCHFYNFAHRSLGDQLRCGNDDRDGRSQLEQASDFLPGSWGHVHHQHIDTRPIYLSDKVPDDLPPDVRLIYRLMSARCPPDLPPDVRPICRLIFG